MRAVLSTIVLAALLGAGGTYAWLYYGGFDGERPEAVAFIDAFGVYDETADKVEELVHLPGTEGNADRAELQSLLSSMLTETLTPERRDTLARIAFTNLETLRKEVDAAQAAQAQVYQLLQDVDNASRVFRSIALREHSAEVVGHARKRAELSARITATLADTNEHTYAIITRVLEDGGQLTQEHAEAINESTARAEERFEALKNLYDELQQTNGELERTFTEFVDNAL